MIKQQTLNDAASSGQKRRLIYILAPSYTGSTLLTFLLAQHPEVATVGELKATARGDLDKYKCSCGKLQKECDFWKEVAAEIQKVHSDFSLEHFGTHFRAENYLSDKLIKAGVRNALFEAARDIGVRTLPGCRSRLEGIIERNREMIEVVCGLQNAEVFLDGSKDPIRLKHLDDAHYWNMKVIYLIRDGRGATNSYMRHYDVPMETAVGEWLRTHAECDRLYRRLGGQKCMKVHYEGLCRSPEATLDSIREFVGLSSECRVSEDSDRFGGNHIMGNQMRLKVEEIKLDEKWKKALTEKELGVFERFAGKLNRSYGYPGPSRVGE